MRKYAVPLLAVAALAIAGGGVLVSQLVPRSGAATETAAGYTSIGWADLIPSAARGSVTEFTGTVTHEQIAELERAKAAAGALAHELRTDLDGEKVVMDGFLLPIAMEGTLVSDFLLVPFVGACIHVPPPPPNQIVFVHIEGGVEVRGLFDLVRVRGTMSATPLNTELAEVGYQIAASAVDLQDQPA